MLQLQAWPAWIQPLGIPVTPGYLGSSRNIHGMIDPIFDIDYIYYIYYYIDWWYCRCLIPGLLLRWKSSGRFFGAVSPVGDPLAGSEPGARSTTASAIDEVWNLGIKVIVPGEHPATYPPQISILCFGCSKFGSFLDSFLLAPFAPQVIFLAFHLARSPSSSGLCQQLRGQMSQHNLQICEQAPGTVTMFILSENIIKYCYYPQFQWILRFSDYSPDFPC